MKKAPNESLAAFLQRQDAPVLVSLLLELAAGHADVQERLLRMQLADRPDKLAAALKKTLTAWKRSKKFMDYREAREFGREAETWLSNVAQELTPRDPAAAVTLFESFIEADASWFDRADDSDGCIGDAVRSACLHWLQAAAQCETPAAAWLAPLMRLSDADEYGAREELLRRADLLLDEAALRELAALYAARMAEAVAGAREAERKPYGVYKLSAALSLLSDLLRDPDIRVRAVLSYSPDPNPLQRAEFAEAYIEAEQPERALPWLEGDWGHLDERRQGLLAQALGALGRFEESAPIRQRIFEGNLSVFAFQAWLEHLPDTAHEQARARAHSVAREHADSLAATTLLLHLDDEVGAERRLIADCALIDGNDYLRLVPLAETLRERELLLGETAVLRALLCSILERARAKAYGHAAQYWARLHELAEAVDSLEPLSSHADFAAAIRARHCRKTAFWTQAGAGRDPAGGSPNRSVP